MPAIGSPTQSPAFSVPVLLFIVLFRALLGKSLRRQTPQGRWFSKHHRRPKRWTQRRSKRCACAAGTCECLRVMAAVDKCCASYVRRLCVGNTWRFMERTLLSRHPHLCQWLVPRSKQGTCLGVLLPYKCTRARACTQIWSKSNRTLHEQVFIMAGLS